VTATVSSGPPATAVPTGDVTILEGEKIIATAPLNGGVVAISALLSRPSLTLRYSGAANFEPSTATVVLPIMPTRHRAARH